MSQKQVSFDVTAEESKTIAKIVARAAKMAEESGTPVKKMDLNMDITAVHANGTPLRLDELLAADDGNFGHDVFGIRRYIDRETGGLRSHFLPRFARRAVLALAGLLLGSSLYAQAIEPVGPKMPPPRHVTRAISAITVKVVAHEDFVRMAGRSSRPWHITTSDEDSCVAWVDTHSNTEPGELAAFKACRAAIDKAVDAAHDRAEKGGQ